MSFTTMDWLDQISRHPETIDTDVMVAAVVALTGSANGVTTPDGSLIDQDDVDESVLTLLSFGFLDSVVSFGADGGEDHLLALRMPLMI